MHTSGLQARCVGGLSGDSRDDVGQTTAGHRYRREHTIENGYHATHIQQFVGLDVAAFMFRQVAVALAELSILSKIHMRVSRASRRLPPGRVAPGCR